ncbi:MAG TPA: hypothetical protein VFD38_02120 [Myxococcaceae bacterium]|nr:hypothetical protein [Myxococcaceae bacterium]
MEHTGRVRVPLALAALCLVVWGAVPGGTFQDDDLVGPLGLAGGWRIRPFLRLTFSAQEALHGHRADLLLAVNLALLALTAIGVWALAVRRLGPSAAFLAGAAFLLQPAHAEAVAYVSGRSMGSMAALSVWAIWAHLKSVRTDDPRTRGSWTGLSLLLLVLAVLTKEVALVLPLLAWAAARWDSPDRPSRIGPLVATAAGLGILLVLAFPRYRTLAGWSLAQHGPVAALLQHLSALPAQLSLWVRPTALSLVHAPGDGWVPPLLGAALLAGVVAVAYRLRHRAPTFSFAVGWALLALVPTHTLLVRADTVTDRSLHLAWVGPAIALGALLAGWLRRAGSPTARALAGATLLAIAMLAAHAVRARIRVWSDPRALWTEAVTRAPGSTRAWNNLGLVLLEQEPRAATAALRRAVALSPSDSRLLSTLVLMESLCPTDGPCR